jgi:hypothetical protein
MRRCASAFAAERARRGGDGKPGEALPPGRDAGRRQRPAERPRGSARPAGAVAGRCPDDAARG